MVWWIIGGVYLSVFLTLSVLGLIVDGVQSKRVGKSSYYIDEEFFGLCFSPVFWGIAVLVIVHGFLDNRSKEVGDEAL